MLKGLVMTLEEKLDKIAANYAEAEHRSYLLSTLPIRDIALRRAERMMAGLSPDFKVHLWRDAYPDAAKAGVDMVYGAHIVWH